MRLLPVLIPLVAAFIGMIGAILSALGFARPGWMPRPRRMVNYRVHYDDSLGNTHPDMKGVGELVVRRQGHDVPDASLAMIRISKGKQALELPRVELKRKDRIRLLVLLSGQRDHLRPGVEGDAYIKGAGRGGGLIREVTPRRAALHTFGWAGFALLSLVAAILVTLLIKPFSTAPPVTVACVPGQHPGRRVHGLRPVHHRGRAAVRARLPVLGRAGQPERGHDRQRRRRGRPAGQRRFGQRPEHAPGDVRRRG
jgi:hypothetical protein